MPHRFAVGASVYYTANFPSSVARSPYKVVRHLPVERDNRIVYRIKSAAESFERTAEEGQLSTAS